MQRHLFGPQYVEKTPPLEWPKLEIESTIIDNSSEASLNTASLSFVGSAAAYILDEWVPAYGVFNGCPYRIEVYEGTNTEIVFDGFIVLSEMQINSKQDPKIIVCPIQELNNNVSVIDKVSVITQGLLRQQGYILNSDYKNTPLVFVSKKSAKDRIIALTNLIFTVVTMFTNAVQNFLSAISDIIGLSAAIGLVELASLFLGLYFEIIQLVDLITKSADLLLNSQRWYKSIGLKTVIVRAFEKEGYTVDFGGIDAVLSKIYIKSSEDGFGGWPIPGLNVNNAIKRQDYGYLISECLELVRLIFDTRVDVRNGVVYIMNKKDPFWNDSAAFTPEDVLIESTTQYDNGFYRNKTEEIFATFRVAYKYDASDAWTLTEKSGDSFEVHRELITELDPKMNTLKGLKDIEIPLAMGVRYDLEETLTDLMTEIGFVQNESLDMIKDQIQTLESYIDSAAGADQDIADVLSVSPINFFFAINSGGLKVEDDTFGIPKLFYADINTVGNLNIPANYKDFIGGPAIYNNYYKQSSPADVNNFKGQYKAVEELRIPFSLGPYQLTKENPYFILNSSPSKFEHINWIEDGHNADVDIEINEPFDTNITEIEIE